MHAKTQLFSFILPALLSVGCTTIIAPPATVSEAVIDSLVGNNQPETPWRLDSSWQCGGLGGAVLRPATFEHVVRQAEAPLPHSTPVPDLAGNEIHSGAQDFNDFELQDDKRIERAWRKYCHHQLNMTPEEHALIAQTQIPHNVLNHGCNPSSLMK